jgi:hypothetical protein
LATAHFQIVFPKVIITVASDADVIDAVKLIRSRGFAHLRAPAGIAGLQLGCAAVEW